jgi:hypothetical protein
MLINFSPVLHDSILTSCHQFCLLPSSLLILQFCISPSSIPVISYAWRQPHFLFSVLNLPLSSLPVLYSACRLPHSLIFISACRHSLVGCTVLHASICSSFYPFCLPLSSLPVICSACWYPHSYIVLHASISTRCDSSGSHYPHFCSQFCLFLNPTCGHPHCLQSSAISIISESI